MLCCENTHEYVLGHDTFRLSRDLGNEYGTIYRFLCDVFRLDVQTFHQMW